MNDVEPPAGVMNDSSGRETEEQGTHITDLPAVVVGSILARLDNPIDVVAALCACRLFWTLARTAPFQLRLRHRQPEETPGGSCNDPLQNSGRYSPQTGGFWSRAAICGIRMHMCATRELDLTGCSIIDEDVAAILADLRCLERLILDGCQKLTSAVTDALANSVRTGPCTISLQRCYRLGPVSARNLLVAAVVEGSRLWCVLLSHLERLDVPRESPLLENSEEKGSEKEVASSDVELAKSFGSLSTGAGLRILALNNCVGLGAPELTSVAMLCPQLELLLLGGSAEGLGLSRAEALSQDKIAAAAFALIRTAELLPRLRVLELTFFTSVVVQAVREQDQKKIQIWDFCDESSVAAAAWILDDLKELKHGSAVNDLLRHIASPVHCASSSPGHDTTPVLFSKSIRAQFWQDGLTLSECLGTGSFSYANFGVGRKSGSLFSLSQSEDRWESLAEDVALALRGAANCSDIRRRTPLHMAAARGDVPMIAGLLAIGAAAIGMKDSSGATALFVAAELGHAHACELLLRGGADVLASNRAGETPLYIAALKGHSAAVGIMLAHCHEQGVNWQDADVYGDGWTPLMAAAVADRRDVGKMLLWAAGAELGVGAPQEGQPLSAAGRMVADETAKLKRVNIATDETLSSTNHASPQSAATAPLSPRLLPQLLNVQNRYGLTALHIAAQKGSVWFVQSLLAAGASPEVCNAYGLRPVDVAKKHNHKVVADILRQREVASADSDQPPKTGEKKTSRKAWKSKGRRASKELPPAQPPPPDLASDCTSRRREDISHPMTSLCVEAQDEPPASVGVVADGVLCTLEADDGNLENAESSDHVVVVNGGVHSLVHDADLSPDGLVTDSRERGGSCWRRHGEAHVL